MCRSLVSRLLKVRRSLEQCGESGPDQTRWHLQAVDLDPRLGSLTPRLLGIGTDPQAHGCCSVTKSSLTLCDPVDCSLPGSSVHGVLQARILEWVACSSPGDLPNTGIKPASPTLQVVSLPLSQQGKPLKNILYLFYFWTVAHVTVFL